MREKVFNGRIVFDHLPKTAGQAINTWLVKEFGSGSVTPNLIGTHDELIRQYGGEYSIVSGHILFEGERLDPRYTYVTFFRDPIDRVISWLYFVIKNHRKEELNELYDWANDFITTEGESCHHGLLRHISNLYVEHFSQIGKHIFSTDEEKLEHALESVKKYDVIGFYEEMPCFLADFSVLLGIPAPKTLTKVNVTKEKPEDKAISSKLQERLLELNKLDSAFYTKLQEWYDQQEKVDHPLIMKSPWKYYERALPEDRISSVSEFKLEKATLKEGYDIVHGQSLCFEVEFALDREISELEAGIYILDTQKRWAFGVNSTLQKQVIRDVVPGVYRISHYVVADLPEGVYTAGFAFTEKLSDGSMNELMWYDRLCEFRVSHPSDRIGVGYANLPSTQMLTKISDIQKITNGAGKMVPVSVPTNMKPLETNVINVKIYNDTDVTWRNDPFRPINLSYHWLDENGTVILFEGVRTPLPDDGLLGYDSTLASMKIVAPKEEGKYKLILTMVQELVAWFENIGFESYNVMIEIKN